MDHLHYAGASPDIQRDALISILRGTDWMTAALAGLKAASLPDGCIVAGALYNLVWNRLTDRPSTHGINDIDVFYFDKSDLSYEAEDAVIQRSVPHFSAMPLPVEIRNQARVHLWFPRHFGFDIAPIESSLDGILRFSAIAHCIGARLGKEGEIEIIAPHGLDDLFAFKIAPNQTYNENKASYEKKAARAQACWPELTVIEWASSG